MNECVSQIKVDAMGGALTNTIQTTKYSGVISLKNGIYNVLTDKLVPHDPRYFVKNYIDVEYKEEKIKDQYVEDHINKIFKNSDKLIRKF
jgi:phage/plasmid-associated DNA primase